jgi:hypothetical protein
MHHKPGRHDTLSRIAAVSNYEGPESPIPPGSLGGAGWVPGIPRLGIPALQMTDGRSGVANTGHLGRYATALTTPLAAGASWDLDVAHEFGALLGEPPRRLVAWQTVPLARGETRTITVTLDPLCLSVFNTAKNDWEVLPGEYRLYAGGSSRNTPLSATVRIPAR